ncbi:MAG: hypothetical protein HY321_04600 [Armatimonadetes bacterium]|nr:hypothetical protein [Armatimonadota bacterium]
MMDEITRRRFLLASAGAGVGLLMGQAAWLCAASAAPTDPTAGDDVFGCDPNPTGDPIGGGDGYRRILTGGDFTVKTPEELIWSLKEARAGQVIYVPDGVALDLTGSGTLTIPEGVTLAGSRGAQASPGALLIRKDESGALLAAGGDAIRVTGLRFEGAYAGPERVATNSRFLTIARYGCEVDNCEVFAFNLTGVSVMPEAMKTHIHHNFLHHIQLGGMGYAVLTEASDTRIIANRLDYGRHFIAGGAVGCGYEAAYNWVGPNTTSHQFDMHGGADRGDGTDIAGDWMHVHHNTFGGKERHVVIRGVPSHGAWIHNNWFAGPPVERIGIAYTPDVGRIHAYRNAYGPDKVVENFTKLIPRG